MNTRDFMMASYGFESIYGLPGGGISILSKELSEYDFYQILGSCSKIALTLSSGGYTNRDTQIKLIGEIFAPDKDVRNRIIRAIKSAQIPQWAIFTDQQILVLLKIALQFSPRDTGKPITTRQDVAKLGHWLLKSTDIFLEEGKEGTIVVPVEYRREQVREFLVTQYFFKNNERLPYRIVRFERLFSLIRSIHPEFDIDAKFSEATSGVNLENYISFCFFLLVNWVNKTTREPDVATEWIISKRKYFEQTVLTQEEIESVLSLLLLDIDNYVKNYEETVKITLRGKDVYGYNFLLMRQRPLIAYNYWCFVCPSPNLLIDKATEGIYWIIENHLKEKGAKKDWDLLPTVWGDAFEVYVHDRFESGFGKKIYHRNFLVSGKEKADGILEGNNVIPFIETKYAHWTYKAKLTGKKEDMLPTLTQLFSGKEKVKGLGQITRSIKELEKGEWQLPFDKKNRKILPIIVVGEAMPMDAYNRKLYEDVAKGVGIFYENNSVLPFIILSVYEVELLEAIAREHGRDKAENLLIQYSEVFRKRNADGYVRESVGFHEFLSTANYLIPNNEPLFKLFDKIYLRAQYKGFPKSKRREKSSR